MISKQVFLVVGTDTGVGKTVFSGLFGRYLMDNGVGVRAVKPFCAGGKADIEFLQSAQSGLGQEEVNYWYSEEPISPAAAELRLGQAVDFEGAINWINSLQSTQLAGISSQPSTRRGKASLQLAGGVGQAGVLLVEGVGGLLAPLAKGKTVASLGQALGAQLIVVAPNRVGVINQVLLTVEAAAKRGLGVACVVLMGQREADLSSLDNAALIRDFLPELAGFKGVFEFPWLGVGADNPGQIGVNVKKVEKVLAKIYEACILHRPSGSGVTDQPSG